MHAIAFSLLCVQHQPPSHAAVHSPEYSRGASQTLRRSDHPATIQHARHARVPRSRLSRNDRGARAQPDGSGRRAMIAVTLASKVARVKGLRIYPLTPAWMAAMTWSRAASAVIITTG